MARYPGTEGELRVPPGRLRSAVAAVFRACGMSAGDADLLAGSLVAADQRGIHSHGVLRVPDYAKKLTRDGVDPRGRPSVASRVGAAIVVDGGNAMGQVAMAFAMDRAVEAAAEHGVAFVAVGHSNHCGAMDQWAMRALPHGMIGIAGTNALPTMAPWGGLDKLVGMNPLAVAFPAGEEPPLVLDIAFGMTAHGKIRVYEQKGHPIPEGWATDAQGRPTTDPAAAIDGLILPAAGHKGIGLAVMVGMLSTFLSGAGYGLESGNMEEGAYPGRDGQFCAAIRVDAFRPLEEVRARADAVSRQIQAARRAEGVERLYPPGLLEAEFERRYAAEGIPLNAQTIAGIREAAEGLGVAVELP
jgi:LDH2 family malate/lactate/ureidoglycolate dehydrogenase